MVALLGIHSPRQLARFRPDTWLGRRQLIAADLLPEIERTGDPRLRDAYFERFIDHRGAFKRTYANRFEEFDARALSEVPDVPELHVLDVAVSDGSTTLSLIDRLERERAGRFRLTATDLDGRYLVLRPRAKSGRRVIVTETGEIVQIVLPPFVFGHRDHEHLRLFPLNRVMRRRADELARVLVSLWRQGNKDVAAEPLVVAHPEFRSRLVQDTRLIFKSWNILVSWPGEKANVVRAMNVMNPGYFSTAEQTLAFANLYAALADGGILAVGSNNGAGSAVDGAIYRRTGQGLVLLAETGAGCRCAAGAKPLLVERAA
jgi:chemotaxis methyl-accepting protein methylase